MGTFLKKKGNVHVTSSPHTPQQNGLAERYNRSLVETTNCLLIQSGAPLSLWTFAMNHANWILNCLPKKALDMRIPHQLLRIDTNLERIRPFGCKVESPYPLHLREKFGPRTQACVYLGSQDGKAILYRLDTGRILHTSRAIFFENVFPFEGNIPSRMPFYYHESDRSSMPGIFSVMPWIDDDDDDDGTHYSVTADGSLLADVLADVLPA